MCFKCANILNHKSRFLANPNGWLQPSTCLDKERWVRHSSASIKAVLRRLREVAENESTASLLRLQEELGFNHSETNVLLDDDLNLDVMGVFAWDWPHIFFAKGTFYVEVNALISELQKKSLGLTVLDRYLRVWAWPRAYAHGRDVCKNFTINGSASELLSFSPVLGTWLESVVQPTGHAARHVASALALCDVVDLLQHSGSGMVSNQDVETAIQRHLRLHLEAYGCTIWIPKHHYSAHLGDEEKKCNTFVLERKHQDAKRYANTRRQTQAYEKGILEDITVEQLFDMDKPFLKTPLRRAHSADENKK